MRYSVSRPSVLSCFAQRGVGQVTAGNAGCAFRSAAARGPRAGRRDRHRMDGELEDLLDVVSERFGEVKRAVGTSHREPRMPYDPKRVKPPTGRLSGRRSTGSESRRSPCSSPI